MRIVIATHSLRRVGGIETYLNDYCLSSWLRAIVSPSGTSLTFLPRALESSFPNALSRDAWLSKAENPVWLRCARGGRTFRTFTNCAFHGFEPMDRGG